MSRGPASRSSRQPEAIDRLVDALSEDVLATSGERLLREVAEDHGDRLTLVREFDQVLARAARRTTKQSALDWSRGLVARMWPRPSPELIPLSRPLPSVRVPTS